MASRGVRDNTTRLYAYCAQVLLGYFGVSAKKLRTPDVQEWIGCAQNELEWKPRTVNVALAAFKVLRTSAQPHPARSLAAKLGDAGPRAAAHAVVFACAAYGCA